MATGLRHLTRSFLATHPPPSRLHYLNRCISLQSRPKAAFGLVRPKRLSAQPCRRLSTSSHARMLITAQVCSSPQLHVDDQDRLYYQPDPRGNEVSTPTIDPHRIELAAARKETPLSIPQCLHLGHTVNTRALYRNLLFLNRELPVRFSKRITELEDLPEDLKHTEPIENLHLNYTKSFEELQIYSDNSRLLFLSPTVRYHGEDLDLELESSEETQASIQKEYADLLQSITNRHKQDVLYMAHGISLFKRYQINHRESSSEIKHFLNSFNRGRLGIRIMVGHHLALEHQLYHPYEPTPSSYLSTPSSVNSQRVGIIEPHCDIEALVIKASQSAQFVFFQHYNTVFPPSVHVEHARQAGGMNIRFPVVPALLHHILFELLKNAMRATAEFHGLDKTSYPDIQVKLSTTPEGDLDITIKDNGGGMPPEKLVKPYNYMCTTASSTVCIDFPSIMTAVENKPQYANLGENLPLCGFGFGLATSKLYARLFNGDLKLTSTPGQGTEVKIRMARLENQIEQLDDV